MKILVTGATGYIGGRLIPRLIDAGHDVCVGVRDPARVSGRSWAQNVEIRRFDLEELDTIAPALEGVDVAFYLVHGMHGGKDFPAKDREAARAFVQAVSGHTRIIYLGGLQPKAEETPSGHLKSRREVGEILREHPDTLEFRAGPIIGSGSASFEMVRYLTERLPIMVAPYWILRHVQPIGVRDIVAYLVGAVESEAKGVVDVGTEDSPTFRQMMHIYAEERGLRRRMIFPLPILAPKLAALWVGFVTPIPNRLAVPLVEGMVNDLIADRTRAQHWFPEIEPVSYREAVSRALERTAQGEITTRWSGALGGEGMRNVETSDWEGVIRETRERKVEADPQTVFAVFSSLGGQRGWLVWKWAWRLRGWLDRCVGGPGLRRGRRHQTELFSGEAVDFWRVEEVHPPHRLLLRAEMRVPGKAWLQWETQWTGESTTLIQTAFFEPRGMGGVMYWYALYPLHAWIFSDLVKAIAQEAEKASSSASAPNHETRPERHPASPSEG